MSRDHPISEPSYLRMPAGETAGVAVEAATELMHSGRAGELAPYGRRAGVNLPGTQGSATQLRQGGLVRARYR